MLRNSRKKKLAAAEAKKQQEETAAAEAKKPHEQVTAGAPKKRKGSDTDIFADSDESESGELEAESKKPSYKKRFGVTKRTVAMAKTGADKKDGKDTAYKPAISGKPIFWVGFEPARKRR